VGASRDVRRLIRRWLDASKSRTLLLTTHYMVEAEELCDRVAIINKGQVLACDTPANLKHNLQRDSIFEIETGPLDGFSDKILKDQAEVKKAALTEMDGGAKLELILTEESALAGVINSLTQKGVKVRRLSKREPTLEDVFMELVGQRMEDVEQEETPNDK
jgi:ABC-2 type transport system ATP-binding protein